ncbi:hypothetical protein BBL07_10780 [Agrobacterium vitis]|nr:hypothetical protein BBL07_10780 [Agrobacterium vitis]
MARGAFSGHWHSRPFSWLLSHLSMLVDTAWLWQWGNAWLELRRHGQSGSVYDHSLNKFFTNLPKSQTEL